MITKKIETKEDLKLFRKLIKNVLKNFLSNVLGNLDDCWSIELLNEDDNYICHIYARAGMTTPDKRRITNDSMSVDNFMYGNGFDLNKHTSDYHLKKVVNRIINEYNDLVDKETEYRKLSM